MDSQQLTSQKNLYISFIILFFMFSAIITANIYADALFLASYPKSWLTLYFLVTPVLTIVLNFIISPLLSKGEGKVLFVLVFGIALFLLFIFTLLPMKIYLIPFTLSISLSAITPIFGAIAWNTIATAFDINVFKQYVFKFNFIGSLGSAIAALASPFVIHYFHNEGLFYSSIVAFMIIASCLLVIKPIAKITVEKTAITSTELYKQSFFRYLFVIVIISSLIDALLYFSYTSVLFGRYSQDGIALFSSIFKIIINLITLLMQMFIAPRLIIYLGLAGIIFIMPIVGITFGIDVALWPTFAAFMIFRGIFGVLKFSLSNSCMELIINPYPSIFRKIASYYLKGYAGPIGTLTAVPIIFIINTYLSLNTLGLVIAVLSVLSILSLRQVMRGYKAMLYDSLKERRFNYDLSFESVAAINFMRQEMLEAFSSQDKQVIAAALSIFEQPNVAAQFQDTIVSQTVAQLLTHSDTTIRYKAVIALKQLNAVSACENLINQLNSEHDEGVGWALVDALMSLWSGLDHEAILKQITSTSPFCQGICLVIQYHSKDLALHETAVTNIKRMINGNLNDKLMMAKIVKYLPPTLEQEAQLITLIHDESTDVATAALLAVNAQNSATLIPVLMTLFDVRTKSYYAEKALKVLGIKALPELLNTQINMPPRTLFPSIRALAAIQDVQALNKLVELSMTNQVSLRRFIAKTIRHYSHYDMTNPQVYALCLQIIEWEAHEIQLLLQLNVPETNPGLSYEVKLQLSINREVFLTWFSLLVDAHAIASIEHHIIHAERTSQSQLGQAYVLLDCLSTNASLRKCVSIISSNYVKNISINNNKLINANLMCLAQHPMVNKEPPMNLMDKIVLLRKVKLFQDVPMDSLYAIAEVAQQKDMAEGEVIFHDGDESDRFYCIVTGKVAIKKSEKCLSELGEADYFGELGLLDDSVRAADAIALKNGFLLYVDKAEFIRILEDLPEIMHAIVKQIIKYLKVGNERKVEPVE